MTEPDAIFVRQVATQEALDTEQRCIKWLDPSGKGVRRLEDVDPFFVAGQDTRDATAHEMGYAITPDQLLGVARRIDAARQPLSATNQDSGSRCCGLLHGCAPFGELW